MRQSPLALILVAAVVWAQRPPLGGAGQDDYREYLEATDHRAFAVGPGGAWGWKAAMPSASSAQAEALAACRSQTALPCFTYAVDGKTVFGVWSSGSFFPLGELPPDETEAEISTVSGGETA